MNWLDGAIRDNKTGGYSSSRIGALIATVAMASSVLILSIAAILTDKDMAMALGAVAVPLAGLNGYNYGANKGNKYSNKGNEDDDK
jgi:hypothetical protein